MASQPNSIYFQAADMPLVVIRVILVGCLAALLAGCSREDKTKIHLDRANEYFANQEYAKAEIEYLSVLQVDPGNQAAIRQLGLALFEQGRYPQAFAFLVRARAADTNNIEIRAKTGFGALLARNFPQAREEALFILSRQPTNEEALVLFADSAEAVDLDETKAVLEKHRAPSVGFHVALGLVELRTNQVAAAEANFKEAVRLNPNSATARATLGNFYVRQGQFELAEPEFKAAAAAASPRSLLSMSYADFKIRQGRAEEGRQMLEALAKKTPDFIPTTIRLAELAFARRDYDSCEGILKPLLARGQANFDAQFLNARLRLARGDAATAMTELERLLAAFPNVAQIHHQLALTHLARGDAVLAGNSVNESLRLDPTYPDAIMLRADLDIRKGDHAAAVGALSLLIKTYPNLVQARMLLAQAHAGRQDSSAALAEYQKLAAAFPKDPQLPFMIGHLRLQQRDIKGAREAFEQVLALDQNHWPAFEQLIKTDLAAGQGSRAFETVQKKLGAAPTNAALHRLLARVHLAQGQTNQAEAALVKAIELDPEEHASCLVLAGLYVSSGQHQPALDRLKSVIAKRPGDVGAHMLAASIHDELKNFSASRDHYEKILAVHPMSAAALNNLAYIYSEQLNERERALELAKKARNAAPNDPAVAHTLGRLAYQTRDYPWSLSLLQESARKLPEHPEVLFDLAQAQLANGQLRDAEASFTKTGTPAAKSLATWVSHCSKPGSAPPAEVQRALQADPTHLPARFVNAWFLQAKGDAKAAQSTFEAILRDYPSFTPANKQLAQIYVEHAPDDPKALDHALKARQAMPRDAAVAKALGILSYKRNDFRRAADLLQETAAQANDAETQYYLGMCQVKLGDITQAREALGKVVSADPNGKYAALARQAIDDLE